MRITLLLFVDSNAQAKLVFMADKGKSEDMTTVGDLVKQAMDDQGRSTREVDRLTEQAGHRIAYSAISRIRSGRQDPNREQMKVLSKVLNIPLKRLEEAAGLGGRFILPAYADRLSTAEREAIRHIIQVMVESKDEKENPDDTPRTNNVAQFQAINPDAAFQDIAARNWRDGDPDIDDDNLLGDA